MANTETFDCGELGEVSDADKCVLSRIDIATLDKGGVSCSPFDKGGVSLVFHFCVSCSI